MALQALQNQRRPEQQVEVTFDDRKTGIRGLYAAPQTPEEVAPPAPGPGPRAPGPGPRARDPGAGQRDP